MLGESRSFPRPGRDLKQKASETGVSEAFLLVGQAGFEPTTPSPPVKCATRLRYCPPNGGNGANYSFHQRSLQRQQPNWVK